MKTVLRQRTIESLVESALADRNVDLTSVKLVSYWEGSTQIFEAEIHYDGELDIEAALKVKPSPDPYNDVRAFIDRFTANQMTHLTPIALHAEEVKRLESFALQMTIFMRNEASARASS